MIMRKDRFITRICDYFPVGQASASRVYATANSRADRLKPVLLTKTYGRYVADVVSVSQIVIPVIRAPSGIEFNCRVVSS